jgi:polyhydroxyalkanoate synthesis regulator protein
MSSFARQQESIREAVQKTIVPFLPPGMEDVGRKNLEMMERAMTLFTPFYPSSEPKPGETAANEYQEEIKSLQAEVARLQLELADLHIKSKRGA